MATITLNYDARNPFAVSMVEALIKSNAFQITADTSKPKRKSSIEVSLQEAKDGKIFKAESVDDLFKQCDIHV